MRVHITNTFSNSFGTFTKAFWCGPSPFEYVPRGEGTKHIQLRNMQSLKKATTNKTMETNDYYYNEDVALGQLPLNFPFVFL
jgi:hypothetical protein